MPRMKRICEWARLSDNGEEKRREERRAEKRRRERGGGGVWGWRGMCARTLYTHTELVMLSTAEGAAIACW